MKIVKLKSSFYSNNTHLSETLHKDRGYGLVTITINDLQFGIPLRSNIRHKDAFITKDNKGLDYSKALLIESNDIEGTFYIPGDEYAIISRKSHHILQMFKKYVDRYIILVETNNQSILDRAYRFTTLKNYHGELGIGDG